MAFPKVMLNSAFLLIDINNLFKSLPFSLSSQKKFNADFVIKNGPNFLHLVKHVRLFFSMLREKSTKLLISVPRQI